ncbi:ABC transporter A family member 12-like [Impatiens glandulifera]|uniref:ABC transporter A family member 12-like n=1 Tax=Impatiens glandulifera TaxID=253017 RepID=UPI001FB17196|nr:ABC transporter A family member 12-like [Impatiens glandulifera]
MAITRNGSSSFCNQSNALLRKNLTYQKRNKKSNCRIILFPVVVCVLLAIQDYVEKEMSSSHADVPPNILNPPEIPPYLLLPDNTFRAVRDNSDSFGDLPDSSCRNDKTCPVTVLVSGLNRSFGLDMAANIFNSSFHLNGSKDILMNGVFGMDNAGFSGDEIRKMAYRVQAFCSQNSTLDGSSEGENNCLRALSLWRNSSSEINNELFKGYFNGNGDGKINEYVAVSGYFKSMFLFKTAYDFMNSTNDNFDINIYYNSTSYNNNDNDNSIGEPGIGTLVNLASNAYLEHLNGSGVRMILEFLKEMPIHGTEPDIEHAFPELRLILFLWVILQLFPVMLESLVYEKQQNLRIMMKMHGLSDGPYLVICYCYFFLLSNVYMLLFWGSCISLGLEFFKLHSFTLQFVFYFLFINLQIAFTFLFAVFFSKVKTASVIAFTMVFGTGLLGLALFAPKIDDLSFGRTWIFALELYPGFSLFRGVYEFSEYSKQAKFMHGTRGMMWENLSDEGNGMKEVLVIMFGEWIIFLLLAYYSGLVSSSGSGTRKGPLFFLSCLFKKGNLSSMSSNATQEEKFDIAQERERVELLVQERNTTYAMISNNLRKVYSGKDGNPDKLAVKGLSLALPRGECFGLLGPNGAGKTSFIQMMIGLTEPTSGDAYIEGMSIRTDMTKVYTSMGVCPQHDLLWESLTGREHLLFYGRLKNLEGSVLTEAVEESLRSVNLFSGGVPDKQAGKYSGGMKRRLSVAIALIGNPKVVYLDEPSTGLDPSSRNALWKVILNAKRNRAIILTTHSMEEAEHLCDRVGIFVDGALQCVGNAKQLKARYGGFYIFTISTLARHDQDVLTMVLQLCHNAVRTYHLSGTHKFELPKGQVRLAEIFEAVEEAKTRFPVQAWGLADTTLEDVFIKVARG